MDIEAIQRQSEEFMGNYLYDPDFLDHKYEIPSFRSLVDQPGVLRVARYVEFPSFETERIFTLVYRPESIEVSAVIGATSLWHSNPQVLLVSTNGGPERIEVSEADQFDPKEAFRKSSVLALPADNCPPQLASFEAIRDASLEAPACRTDTFDGITYTHRVANSHDFHTFANWSNPDPAEHGPQCSLVAAYAALLRQLKLYGE